MTENRSNGLKVDENLEETHAKSPKIGFGYFAWKVGVKKHQTMSIFERAALREWEMQHETFRGEFRGKFRRKFRRKFLKLRFQISRLFSEASFS